MALYTTKSYNNIASEWEDIQRRELERQQQAAQAQYEQAQLQAANAQKNQRQGGLAGVLAGIGESIGNVGKSLVSMGGRGIASIGDLFSGNTKNLKDFEQWEKENLWGNKDMSDKDLYNRTGGASLDAASTVADLIPVVGAAAKAGTTAAKAAKIASSPLFNMAQGATSGYAQEFIDNGENASLENALKRAAVGTAATGIGQAVGGKLARKAAANPATGRIGKALQSNLGRAALSGASAGAVGGGLATALDGGDFGQTLAGAINGAQGGALGGATYAGTMGMLGTLGNKLSNKVEGKTATPAIPETTIAKKVAEPEIATPARKGIAVTDYDAGTQKVNVKRPNAKTNEYSLGKNAGSTLDGILGPNNKRKLPNLEQPTSSQILKKASAGDWADVADYLKSIDETEIPNALKEIKGYATPEDYAALKAGIQEAADIKMSPFDAIGVSNKSNLPMLNRQQYYEDTIGKVGGTSDITGRKGASYKDVPDYMNSHLTNEGIGDSKISRQNVTSNNMRRNDEILRELFNDQTSDISDLYKRYEDLAQADNANYVYTPDNVETALRLNPELNDRLTSNFVDEMGLRRNLAVGGNPSLRQNVDVAVMDTPSNETVYTKRTLAPKVQEQNLPATRGQVAPAVQEDVPLIQKGTPEYEAIKQRDFIENRKRELNRNLSDGVLAQYGTVRLSDSSEIGNIRKAALDMAKLGLTDRADIDGFVSRITGAEGEIPKTIRKALYSAGKTKGKVNISMQKAYELAGADQNAQKRAKSTFDAIGKKPKYAPDVNGNMNRLEMYEFGKELEKQAYKDLAFASRNGTNETLRGAGETLRLLSEAFIDKATDGVDIKTSINANRLKNVLPGNETWAKKVDDFVKNAKTVQDARSFISSPTKMSLWANAENFNIGTYGQRQGDMANTVERAIRGATSARPGTAAVQMAATAAIESKPVQQKMLQRNLKQLKNIEAGGTGRTGIKGMAGTIGDKIGNIGKALNNDTLQNTNFGNFMSRRLPREIGLTEASNIGVAGQLADAQNLANEAVANYQNANTAYQNAMAQAQPQSQGANQLQTLSTAMDNALAAGDITAYGQLADLYKKAYAIYGQDTAQTTKALTANQSKALTGLQQVEQLSQMTPDVGTALANSPLSFLVNMTGGNEYANQAQSLALTLGYLQSGANITPREAENIGKSYVPTAYDSEQVRQQKLARARQLLNNYLGDTRSLEV